MRVNHKTLAKALNLLDKEFDAGQVSLFVISTKHPCRLKKLNLDPSLSRAERAQKLHKWGQQHRFVAVVEIGDTVFAHANAKYSQQLHDSLDLTMKGKQISVKTLSEEESYQLSTVGELFEEYVLHSSELEEEEKPENDNHHPETIHPCLTIKQYLAKNALISDQMKMDYLIVRMQNIPSQVILKYLKKMNEARREDQKLKEADDRKHDIKTHEIKKDLRRAEIIKEEVIKQTLKKTLKK